MRQVCPPGAYADVIWLVVDRTREEQDAGFGQPRAVAGEFVDACDAGETDRACRRACPLEGFGVPFKEGIEEGRSSIKLLASGLAALTSALIAGCSSGSTDPTEAPPASRTS